MDIEIAILRLSHRPERDKRLTTHVFLSSRALGASRAVYTGLRDEKIEETIEKLKKKWGGDYSIVHSQSWKKTVKEFKDQGYTIVHLTMYGDQVHEKLAELQAKPKILIVVGGEKVPYEIYEHADYNIAIGKQPHSEVSALAILIDRLRSQPILW
ncbi:tRNA (cytidine(56)-2'-O)-methyltransferase [Candidatus Gugararchaeum adminiculabundum]|nr:tRNA (cytidine(56)-2'-O)-methyltransferase [Candidatus Gugararchaeum adminiculabundum]